MESKYFEQSYKWEAEKGLSDNEADKGGITNDGITWKRYEQVCKRVLGVKPTRERFEQLTKQEIKQFYDYSFKQIGFDKIDNKVVAAVCFDFALNSAFGKREIQKVLQGMGYILKADNIFGPVTLRILNRAVRIEGAYNVCWAILVARQRYVESLVVKDESQRVFLKGWTNRIEDWKQFVLANT